MEKVGNKIAEKISKCPNVKAVGYIGSIATGFVDKISKDIDLICIVNKLPSLKKRRKYLGKQNYSKDTATIFFENFKINDLNIDITFKEIKWFENVLKKIEPVDEFNEKHILFLLQNMMPIIDEYEIIKNFKEKAKYTNQYRERKIEFLFSILLNTENILKKAIKRDDIAFIDYRFSFFLEKYIALIFALNGRYYSDIKWSEKFIEQFEIKPKNAIKNIRKIAEKGNRPYEINQKIKFIKKMISDIQSLLKTK